MTTGPGEFDRLVGIRPAWMDDGRATFDLVLRADHLNPYGGAHGGVIYTLVDTAMGAALTTRLGPGERCTTLEIKINYLAPVTDGTLRCEAAVVERTRRIGVLEARVRDGGSRLIALATGSFYVVGGDTGR